MTNWTTEARQGYKTKTVRHGNCTIVIHRPILSKPERAKREQHVRNIVGREMFQYIARQQSNLQNQQNVK